MPAQPQRGTRRPPHRPPTRRCLSTCPPRWAPPRRRRLAWSTCCATSRTRRCPPWPQRCGALPGSLPGAWTVCYWCWLVWRTAEWGTMAIERASGPLTMTNVYENACPTSQPPSPQVGDMVTGLRGLRSRLLEIREYLEAVRGRGQLLPGNHDGCCGAPRLLRLQRVPCCSSCSQCTLSVLLAAGAGRQAAGEPRHHAQPAGALAGALAGMDTHMCAGVGHAYVGRCQRLGAL